MDLPTSGYDPESGVPPDLVNSATFLVTGRLWLASFRVLDWLIASSRAMEAPTRSYSHAREALLSESSFIGPRGAFFIRPGGLDLEAA